MSESLGLYTLTDEELARRCGYKGTSKMFCYKRAVDGGPCNIHREGFVHPSHRPGFKHWTKDLTHWTSTFTANLDVMRRELDPTYPEAR
jgi:hypothetical protein